MVDRASADEMQEIVQKPLAGRFEIEQLIGRGRVSFVYSAREVGSGNPVALKIIPLSGPLDADLVRRFQREAARAGSLRHSHIVPILASGASGTLLWCSMEHVKGRSLAELLRDSTPMDLETCLRMLDQVASALDYAHRRSVIHANVKPTNILVDEDGWVRVTDFAVLRAFSRGTVSGLNVPTLRTPEYMAPEQFFSRGESASADQYSMGVIAYECLGGALPFVGDSFEEIARLHQEETPARLTELREDIPILIADAVEQALRKRPTDRFANVLDFVTVLRGGPPQGAEPLAPAEEPRGTPHVLTIDAPRRRIPFLYIGIGGAAALALAAVLLVTRGGSGVSEVIDESQFTRTAPPEAPPLTITAPALPPQRTAPTTAQPPPGQAAPRESPQATRPIAAPARPPRRAARVDSARLFVNASPWGALYLDGELIGNTPKANLAVAPGVHVIRVERDGFEPFEVEFEVTEGEEMRMTDIVLKPRQP
jgi:serine/threonine-protein kinase